MSKKSIAKPPKKQDPIPTKQPPKPKIDNLENIENKRREQKAKSLAEEREKFSVWLKENESEKAASLYLQCADNLETLRQKQGANFYACQGEKFSLPLKELYAVIDNSKALTEKQRQLFRAAIDAYLRFRGISVRVTTAAAPKTKVEPASVSSGSSKIVSKLRVPEQPKPRRTVPRRTADPVLMEASLPEQPRLSLKGSREAPPDPRSVSHEDLLKRLNKINDIDDGEIDYDQVGPLLSRINEEFDKYKLIGELKVSPAEYAVLKNYFRTTCRSNYETSADSEDFILDRPCLVAMVEIAKRTGRLDFWDEIARLLYGLDSEKFDESWLEGAFCRGMLRYGKALVQTNRQRTLATIMNHAGPAADSV